MTLTITTPDLISYEYALPEVSAELLARFASGELDQIILIEEPPEIRRGHPMRFRFER